MVLTPEVNILFLGDLDCGKASFLARLPEAQHGKLEAVKHIDPVREHELPLTFDISLYARPYRFRLFSTSSPQALIAPGFPDPDFVILTYDISSRDTLRNAQHVWHHGLLRSFVHLESTLPIMLLGLKRDLRHSLPESELVLPLEGHALAQQLQCDHYAECSALTGELMREVLEDITKTAARTTTERGAKSEGSTCTVI